MGKHNKDTRRIYLKARKENFKRKMENLIEEGINTEMSTTEDTCSESSPKEEPLKESESTRQFFLDGWMDAWIFGKQQWNQCSSQGMILFMCHF